LISCTSATGAAECRCCRAGYELLPSKQCSPCPTGTFARTANNSCTPCRTGSTTFGPASNACGREYFKGTACACACVMRHLGGLCLVCLAASDLNARVTAHSEPSLLAINSNYSKSKLHTPADKQRTRLSPAAPAAEL
jgi:hypothetical protein